MLLPVFGVLLFLYTQSDIGHRALKKYVDDMIADTKEQIPQKEEVMARLSEEDRGVTALARYMHRSGCRPAFLASISNILPHIRPSSTIKYSIKIKYPVQGLCACFAVCFHPL